MLDAFAMGKGYGLQLSRAMIKIYKGKKMNVLDTDWLYSMFYNTYVPLPERLEALGWTGDEVVLEDEGRLHDHWGTN